MLNPQITNGGQTAYVLSKIYEDQKENDYSIFEGKEVMLKVMILRIGLTHFAIDTRL